MKKQIHLLSLLISLIACQSSLALDVQLTDEEKKECSTGDSMCLKELLFNKRQQFPDGVVAVTEEEKKRQATLGQLRAQSSDNSSFDSFDSSDLEDQIAEGQSTIDAQSAQQTEVVQQEEVVQQAEAVQQEEVVQQVEAVQQIDISAKMNAKTAELSNMDDIKLNIKIDTEALLEGKNAERTLAQEQKYQDDLITTQDKTTARVEATNAYSAEMDAKLERLKNGESSEVQPSSSPVELSSSVVETLNTNEEAIKEAKNQKDALAEEARLNATASQLDSQEATEEGMPKEQTINEKYSLKDNQRLKFGDDGTAYLSTDEKYVTATSIIHGCTEESCPTLEKGDNETEDAPKETDWSAGAKSSHTDSELANAQLSTDEAQALASEDGTDVETETIAGNEPRPGKDSVADSAPESVDDPVDNNRKISSVGPNQVARSLNDLTDYIGVEGSALADEEVEGKLKGDAIESCQEMAGTSWRKKLETTAFDGYINGRLKVARKEFLENLQEMDGYNQVADEKFDEKQAYSDNINKNELINIKQQVHESYGLYSSKVTSALNNVSKCLALYTVIKKSPSRDMTFSEDNKVTKSASFDSQLKCSSQGYETQDYRGCQKAIMAYDAIYIGRKVVIAGQQLDYMDTKMDIQSTLAKNAQTDATAGLKAQKADIEKKAQMANTRAVTETAAFGALIAAYNSLPDIDTINDECNSSIKRYDGHYESALDKVDDHGKKMNDLLLSVRNLTYLSGGTSQTVPSEDNDITGDIDSLDNLRKKEQSGACKKYVYDTEGEGVHAMINNSDAKAVIEKALADSGVNIATMLGTAAILNKQAGRVGDAIGLVDQHDPETMEYGGEDVLTTECQINPGAAACANSDVARDVDYYNQGINVDGIQFANSDSTLGDTDEFGNRTAPDSSGDTTRDGNPTGFSGIDGVDKGSGGLAEGPGGAASVKATGTNGLGSGAGGGGGGGGGAGSAPSNGSAKTGGDPSKKAFVGSAKKMSFSGGSGGLRFGTSSRGRGKKTKSKNPFANLFKKGGKKKGGVLNFRGVASKVGSKKGSIFKMISNRYTIVNKEKRLIKYEKESLNGDLPPN